MTGITGLGSLALGAAEDEQLAIGPATGHFTLGGKPAALTADRRIVAAKGSFVVGGKDANLIQSERILTVNTGHYNLFGYAAGPHGLNPDTGHFLLSGNPIALTRTRLGISNVGHFALSGKTVNFTKTNRMKVIKGHFSLAGYAAIGTVASDKDILMNLIKVQGADFSLRRGQEIATQGSGLVRGRDLRPALWYARITSVPVRHSDASAIEALLDALDGVIGTFNCYNPKKMFPRTDPTGSIVLGYNVQIHSVSGDTMRLKGLPPQYEISRGDFLSFDYGDPVHRALHRSTQTVTSDGSGITPSFKVRPGIRTGAVPNLSVRLRRPAAEMALLPETIAVNQLDLLYDVIEFEAVQVI